MEINCPSGLRGRIRKLRGAEANILADQRTAAQGATYDRILAAIWEETLDPGPYADIGVTTGEAPVPWGKILVADRFVTLVGARSATYGSSYFFPVLCGETGRGGCRHRFEWEIDLVTQLPLYDLPEESRAKIAAGNNSFETEIAGRRVVFKLQTGDDEKKAGEKLATKRSEMMTTALAGRIISIDGVERGKVEDFLKAMDLDHQLAMMGAFDAVDGGFETEIEIECPKCLHVMDVTLPFEGQPFWLPRSRKAGKREGRTGRTLSSG